MTKVPTLSSVPIERVRDFWDSRPCNLRHSPAAAGTREYFDQVEERKYLVEPHIPGFAEFERWRGRRVLEIGCGLGTDTINFARAGARVSVIELSERSLELARKRAELYGCENEIDFYHGNAEDLASVVPVEPFDLIYSFGVIHHTPHPERVLAALPAYMAPRARLKLMVYHRYAWKVLWIVLTQGQGRFWRLQELVSRHSEAQSGCPVTFTYSRQAFKKLLAAHGFEAEEARVDHIFPYRIPDYVEYRYRKVWYFRWMPAFAFRWLERRFGWHLLVTARLAGERRKTP